MGILLDTNALLWLLTDDARLSLTARKSLESAPEIIVSEISLWEIAIKISIGKLRPIQGLHETVRNLGFRRLHLEDYHLQAYESLPLIHRDPFDRMLATQAMTEKLRFLTSDGIFKDYGVRVIVADR